MLLAGSRIYTTLALGAMIVVFMSMVGSLTVLPALLGKLGDRIDRGVLAVLAAGLMRVLRWEPRAASAPEGAAYAAAAPQGRPPGVAHLGCGAAPVVAPPGRRRGRIGGTARRARPARVQHASDDGRVRRHAVAPADRADVRQHPARIPRLAEPGGRGRPRERRHVPAGRAPHSPTFVRRALATGVMREPIRTVVNRDHTVAQVEIPLVGHGRGREVRRSARDPAAGRGPRSARRAARRPLRRDRTDGGQTPTSSRRFARTRRSCSSSCSGSRSCCSWSRSARS